MSAIPPSESARPVIDIRQVDDWKTELEVSFDQRASLKIAYLVLWIFAGVYSLSFVMAFVMFGMEGASYEKASELVRFLLQSVLPLVTLAVGYYLGDRARQGSSGSD
jgi:hypothetical protein